MTTPSDDSDEKNAGSPQAPRIDAQVQKVIRQALEPETSAQAIARGLTNGFNQEKYDAVLADLEAMAEEIKAMNKKPKNQVCNDE